MRYTRTSVAGLVAALCCPLKCRLMLPPAENPCPLPQSPPSLRHLYCPKGTKYAGRFALTHMNNW